jgi:hypothetical protein
MVIPKTFNGITIQVEWLYAEHIQRHNHASKLNGYAEDSQRHNHPSWTVITKTVNGMA